MLWTSCFFSVSTLLALKKNSESSSCVAKTIFCQSDKCNQLIRLVDSAHSRWNITSFTYCKTSSSLSPLSIKNEVDHEVWQLCVVIEIPKTGVKTERNRQPDRSGARGINHEILCSCNFSLALRIKTKKQQGKTRTHNGHIPGISGVKRSLLGWMHMFPISSQIGKRKHLI